MCVYLICVSLACTITPHQVWLSMSEHGASQSNNNAKSIYRYNNRVIKYMNSADVVVFFHPLDIYPHVRTCIYFSPIIFIYQTFYSAVELFISGLVSFDHRFNTFNTIFRFCHTKLYVYVCLSLDDDLSDLSFVLYISQLLNDQYNCV